jgi:hypothetical protein
LEIAPTSHQLITHDKTHGRLIVSARGFPSFNVKEDIDVGMSFGLLSEMPTTDESNLQENSR